MFGSVPLKTYLPDGDIDLAMFQEKGPKLRESWTTDLKNYLESETAKAAPQYRIKDVQIINAEVRHLYQLPTGLLGLIHLFGRFALQKVNFKPLHSPHRPC